MTGSSDEIETLNARIDAAMDMVARRLARVTGRLEGRREPDMGACSIHEPSGEEIRDMLDVNEEPVNPLRRWRWE